jgi:hypothetical protein
VAGRSEAGAFSSTIAPITALVVIFFSVSPLFVGGVRPVELFHKTSFTRHEHLITPRFVEPRPPLFDLRPDPRTNYRMVIRSGVLSGS